MKPDEQTAPEIETETDAPETAEPAVNETRSKKTRTASTPSGRVNDAMGDIEEQLGFVNYQLARKDKSWLTPDVADRIRQQLAAITNGLSSINATLDVYQPPRFYTARRSIRASADIGNGPSGMFAEALRQEAAEEAQNKTGSLTDE